MAPEQFWRLHPVEFWWLVDARKPKQEHVGGLTEADIEELYQVLQREGVAEDG